MASTAHGNSAGKRLVILGCGYVGAAVAEAELAQDVAVTAVTRNPTTAAALRMAGVETVEAVLGTTLWHSLVPARPDWVLYSAAAGGGGVEGYRESYLRGLDSMARWLAAANASPTIVYTSSTSVYPAGDGAVVDEKSATVVPGEHDRAAVLVAAEERLRAAVQAPEGGVRDVATRRRAFILRLAGIYGPMRHHLLDQVASGEVAGVGEHRLNLIHRDDIVSAVSACFRAAPEIGTAIFNVADDAPTAKRDVVAWLATRLGCPIPRFTGTPASGRRQVTPDRVISNAAIKAALGWAPRFPSFREGYTALLAAEREPVRTAGVAPQTHE